MKLGKPIYKTIKVNMYEARYGDEGIFTELRDLTSRTIYCILHSDIWTSVENAKRVTILPQWI